MSTGAGEVGRSQLTEEGFVRHEELADEKSLKILKQGIIWRFLHFKGHVMATRRMNCGYQDQGQKDQPAGHTLAKSNRARGWDGKEHKAPRSKSQSPWERQIYSHAHITVQDVALFLG